MTQHNISNTTTTGMNAGIPEYSVSSKVLDENTGEKEFYYYNANWSKYLGYLKQIPEFKEAIRALARWTCGKGFVTDSSTKVRLNFIRGWGEDSFQSILTNMIIIKKANGDAYSEIIKDENGKLINLKPLNPANVRHVISQKGIIKRYDIFMNGEWKPYPKEKIFHICNDRIASEAHGISVLEACQWVIDARNEAMNDWRKVLHRSTMRVIYVDMDNSAKLTTLKEQWKDAIKNGEVLLIPGKKGVDMEVADYTTPPLQPYLDWIRYLEGFFYQAVGVSKAIANTADFTEAASKVGYLTFEPVYTEEQTLLEQDIKAQLILEIKLNRPPSLHGVLSEDEEKNTSQVGFQPNELNTEIGRVE